MQEATVTTTLLDGTFYTAPLHFEQIWIVRVLKDGFCFPVAYAFFESKSIALYSHVLEKLHEAAPFWTPQDVVVDFETAEHTAVRAVFPGATLHGCLFHLGQNLDRHAKSLTNFIIDDEGRMLLAKGLKRCCLPS